MAICSVGRKNIIIVGSIWMAISKWAIRMAKKFSGHAPVSVWYRIWGRLRLYKVSVRAA